MATAPKTPSTAKKKNPRAKTGATTVRVELMRREALRLRNQGQSCADIGDALGVTRERAWQLVSEELTNLKAETREEAIEVRHQQTARLNSRLKQLQKIIDESKDHGVIVNAVAKMVAIDVEMAKLWGAYAPAKTDITSNGETVQGAFAVPLGEVDPAAWAATALAQSAGEEAAAEKLLGKGPRNEAAPAA